MFGDSNRTVMVFFIYSIGAEVKDGAHVRNLINNWDKMRRREVKSRTGRSRVVRNEEVDAELEKIFSSKSLPKGHKVSTYILK